MVELCLELHDHDGIVHKKFYSKFDHQATLGQLKEKIRSKCFIDCEDQQLFSEGGQELDGLGESSLQSFGLKHGGKVIIKHALLPQWENYLIRMDEFREVKENRLKKEKALEANEKAKELYKANFFSAYATFDSDWLRKRKEYATFLDNIPAYMKEAAKSFFTRKFSDKLIELDFKDKPSGTRSGTVCIVKYEEIRRVFYLKTNHNASSISITKCSPLNMIELFIYKFLETLGVGAAVDFIPNVVESDKIIYIGSEEIIPFKTLLMLERDWNDFERKIVKKREEVTRGVIQLSLLAQILGLDDLNSENIGFNESAFSFFIVDFHTGYIDNSVAFEGIDCPKTAMSMVAQLKMNLGRFMDFVEGVTFEEQLKIVKECIVQWEICSKLDVAFAKLEEDKHIFNRAGLLFCKGTETLKEYISIVREKISKISNL